MPHAIDYTQGSYEQAAARAARLILNPAQAEAVYSAMCALNNVGGRLRADLPGGSSVIENESGRVWVYADATDKCVEQFSGQAAFATAYRVDGSAALLADALAAPAGAIPAGFLDAAA